MNIDTNTVVSTTEANQNFSKVTRIADRYGRAVVFKNNVPSPQTSAPTSADLESRAREAMNKSARYGAIFSAAGCRIWIHYQKLWIESNVLWFRRGDMDYRQIKRHADGILRTRLIRIRRL